MANYEKVVVSSFLVKDWSCLVLYTVLLLIMRCMVMMFMRDGFLMFSWCGDENLKENCFYILKVNQTCGR